MTIHVKDTEPPRVISCPNSFEETLTRGQMLKKVGWDITMHICWVTEMSILVGLSPCSVTMLGCMRWPPASCLVTTSPVIHPYGDHCLNCPLSEGKHHVLYQASDAEGNRARCGFTLTIKRERSLPPPPLLPPPGVLSRNHSSSATLTSSVDLAAHTQPRSPYPHCNQIPSVPNGKMVCILRDDQSLKCTPVCEHDHVFYQKFSSRPPTYICDRHRSSW